MITECENTPDLPSHHLCPVSSVQITSQNPNHPANSFFYPRLSELPPLATVKLTRQGRTPNRQNPLSNHILPHATLPKRFSGRGMARTCVQACTYAWLTVYGQEILSYILSSNLFTYLVTN